MGLLGQILKIFASRRVQQQLARQGLKPVPKAALMLQVALIAIFFSLELVYVLDELQHRGLLRKFARVAEIPTPQQLYSFLGKFTRINLWR